VSHSWFNRFRKLLVRYEKLDRSYIALVMLAAAIIVFRMVPGDVNIIPITQQFQLPKWLLIKVNELTCPTPGRSS
jgi:hypothetical protein